MVPIAGTFVQAVLGGITVRTGLSPITVALHFLVSLALIAFVTILVIRSGEPGDKPRNTVVPQAILVLSRVLLVVTAIVIILGTIVTGSGPHSGNPGTPRFNIDPRVISWLHADTVLLFLGLLVGMLIALHVLRSLGRPATPRALRAAYAALAVAFAQGILGYTQYFTGLPWMVVATHMLGSCLLWSCVWWLATGMRTRGVQP